METNTSDLPTASPSMTERRRGRPRQYVGATSPYVDFGQDNGGIVLDISEHGMSVQTAMPLIEKTFSRISFQMGGGGPRIEVSGRLKWISETKKVAGIEFVQLSSSARSSINHWMTLESAPVPVPYEPISSNSVPEDSFASAELSGVLRVPDEYSDRPIPEASLDHDLNLVGPRVEGPRGFGKATISQTSSSEMPITSSLGLKEHSVLQRPVLRQPVARNRHISRIILLALVAFGVGLAVGHGYIIRNPKKTLEAIFRSSKALANQPAQVSAPAVQSTDSDKVGSTISGNQANVPSARMGSEVPPLSGSSSGKGEEHIARTQTPAKPLRAPENSKAQQIVSPTEKNPISLAGDKTFPDKTSSAKNGVLPAAVGSSLPSSSGTPSRISSPNSSSEGKRAGQLPAAPAVSSTDVSSPSVSHSLSQPVPARVAPSIPASLAGSFPPISTAANSKKSSEVPEAAVPDASAENHRDGISADALLADQLDPPQLLSPVEPVYPKNAARHHIAGTVELRVVVETNGTVQKVTPVSGPPELIQAAESAAREFRYTPALLNGKPIQAIQTVKIKFKLNQ